MYLDSNNVIRLTKNKKNEKGITVGTIDEIKYNFTEWRLETFDLNDLVQIFNKKYNENLNEIYYLVNFVDNNSINEVAEIWATQDDYFKTDEKQDKYYLIYDFKSSTKKERISITKRIYNFYYRKHTLIKLILFIRTVLNIIFKK